MANDARISERPRRSLAEVTAIARSQTGADVTVPVWVVQRLVARPRALALWVQLRLLADGASSLPAPTHSELAATLQCSVSTVQHTLRELRDAGCLAWEQATHNGVALQAANVYTVVQVQP